MNPTSVDSTSAVCPSPTEEGGSIPASTLQIKDLIFEVCSKPDAIEFNAQHHSRLPIIRNIGIKYAFRARFGEDTYITAIWSHPVARLLPKTWLELRRMACASNVPKNAASAFLSWMVRYIKKNHPIHEKLISYQDTEVHEGTIYKAAGWTVGAVSKRSTKWHTKERPDGKQLNDDAVYHSGKVRWEMAIQTTTV